LSHSPTFARCAGALLALLLLISGTLAMARGKSDKGGDAWSFITEESDDPMLPGINPLDVPGNIVTAGSSTVFPLSERMVERFKDEGFPGNISVDSIGTGAGFERFCSSGETDISNASRAINAKETANCRAIDREPIEMRVGTDALAVVVSRDNTFADNVSMEQLHVLFSTAANWSDINPDWPNEPIQRFIPGTDSGTFDYFVEEVFHEDEEPILSADNLQMSEDDNILVQGVLGSPYSVGFFGYAYYTENADKLNVLDIDGVEASTASVDNASYPLARPMYIYTTAAIMTDKPQVAAFVNFYLAYVNEEVVDIGYFPANQAALDAAKQAWLDALDTGN
jgi:phosphate transport system substrate-binding protein